MKADWMWWAASCQKMYFWASLKITYLNTILEDVFSVNSCETGDSAVETDHDDSFEGDMKNARWRCIAIDICRTKNGDTVNKAVSFADKLRKSLFETVFLRHDHFRPSVIHI